ncbi:MAG: DUF11 domain-containing protein, partial [Geobacteraceae bacterium]|nr:DUF11 domain-containing protein [Geobacteraceae bacterium]
AISVSGGVIPANGTCDILIPVTATTGSYVNTIAAGIVSTVDGLSNPDPTSASLAVVTKPTISLSLNPASIPANAVSTATFNISNPAANTTPLPGGLTGASFTIALPSGVSIAFDQSGAGNCTGQTGNAFTAGQTNLSFSGLSIAAGSTCNVTVVLTGATPGTYQATSSGVLTNQTQTAGTASNTATLTIVGSAPTFSKSFSPNPVPVPGDGTSVLTFVLTNPNSVAVTLNSTSAFTDTFPTTPGAMTYVSTVSNSCGGTLKNNTGGTLAAGNPGIRLDGGTIPANSSCSVAVRVTASVPGLYQNTSSVLASSNAGSSALPATANLTIQSQADLAVVKTVNNSAPLAGSQITLTSTLTNNGPVPSTNISITDLLPNGYTFVSATPSQGSYSSISGLWSVGTLGVGAVATLDMVAAVLPGGTYASTASITTSDYPDPVSSNNSSTVTPVPVAVADVTTSINAPAVANAGSTVLVPIRFTNNGPSSATSVIYAATINTGLSGVSCSGATCSYTSGTGAIVISGLSSSLASGQSSNVTLSYTAPINGSVNVGTTIGTATNQGSNSASDSAIGSTSIVAGVTTADVTTTVTMPGTANAGSSVNVTLSYINLGPGTATITAYSATLPAGLSGVSCSGSGASCSYNSSNGAVTVSGLTGTMTSGTTTNVTLTFTAPVSSTVTVLSAIQTSTDQGTNSAADTASGTITIIAVADVTATAAVPAVTNAGSTVNVPIRFANYGPSIAAGVTYAITLPSGLSGVTCSGATCSYSGGTVSISGLPASLSSGQSENLIFSYTAPASGSVSMTAAIATTTGEGSNSAPDSASGSTTVTTGSTVADVTTTVTAPATANSGGTVTSDVTFINLGPSSASSVTYAASLNAGLTGVSCSGAATCSYTSGTGAVSFSGLPSSLTAGQSAVVYITWTAPSSGSVATSTTIGTSSSQGDNAAADIASGNTLISAATTADVTVALSAPASASAASSVTIAASYSNLGTASASGVTYSLSLPSGLSGVSCSGDATCSYDSSSGVVTYSGLPTTLAAGVSKNINIVYTAPASGSVMVTGSIVTTTTESSSANNSASASSSFTPLADVTTSVTAPSAAYTNTVVTVPITFTNNGPSTAAGVAYTVTLSTGLSSVSCNSGATCSYNASNGVVTMTGLPTSLTLLQTAGFNLVYTATSAATVTVNTSVSTTTTESSGSNNSANGSTSVTVIPPTVLSGTITDFSTGLPVSGASVQIVDGSGHTYMTSTNGSGVYTFTGTSQNPLSSGTATVTSTKAGYLGSISHPALVDNTTVTQNMTMTQLSISGVVTELVRNIPIVGATVTLTQGGTTCITTSGAGGAYSIAGSASCPLVAGSSSITASLTKYQDGTATPTILSSGPTTQNLQMGTVDLLINMSDSKTSVQSGETNDYLVSVINNGSIAATGVTLYVKFPSYLTYVSDTSGLTPTQSPAGQYNYILGSSLAIGATWSFTVRGLVANTLPDGQTSLSLYSRTATTSPEIDATNNEVSDVDTVTTHPDLTLAGTFTSSPPATSTSTVSYSFGGSNLGHVVASGINITTVLDSLLSYKTGTALISKNGGTPASITPSINGSTLTFAPSFSLSPTDTYILTFDTQVGQLPQSPSSLVATGSIASLDQTTDLVPGNNSATVSVPTVNSADLVITKTAVASSASAKPGDLITYTLAYRNDGVDTATASVITDTIPAHTTLEGGITGTGCSSSSGVITCNLGDLAHGASGNVTYAARIASTLPAGVTTIDNTATISSSTSDATSSNNSSTTHTTVTGVPDLAVTISDGVTQSVAGDALAYSINYQNKGSVGVTGVTVIATLLNGVTFVSASNSGSYNADNKTVTWNIGALTDFSAHSLTFIVSVDSNMLPDSVVGTRVVISDDGSNGTDLNPGDNNNTDNNLIVAPNLILEKKANSPVYIGNQFSYTLDWSNAGNSTAKSVVITDTLPANTTVVSGSISDGGVLNNGVITWNLGDKGPGTSGVVSFAVTPDNGAGGAAKSAPTLSTKSGSGSVVVTSNSTVPPTGSKPFCELDKCAAFKGLYEGTTGTTPLGYNDNPRLTLFNDTDWSTPLAPDVRTNGNQNTNGVDLGVEPYWTQSTNLAANWVTMNTAGVSVGNYSFYRQAFCLPLNATGLSSTLKIASDDVADIYLNGTYVGEKIGAGDAASFGVSTVVQSGINIMSIQLLNNRHGGHALYGGNDHSGLLFNLNSQYSGLRPFLYGSNFAKAGQSLTFTVDEESLGGKRPYLYKIDFGDGTTVDYQDGTTFNHTYTTAGTYAVTITARAAYGCTATDTVTVTVVGSSGNILVNAASVAYQDTSGKALSETSGAGVEVIQSSDLAIIKTLSSGGTVPGQGVVYNITVTNNGPSDVTGAAVRDNVPSLVTAVTWTCTGSSGGTCANASGIGNRLDETADLLVGGSVTYVVSGTVDPSASGVITNTATVTAPAGFTDITQSNNSSSVSHETAFADLAVTASIPSGGSTLVNYGSDITFHVALANNGPLTATNVKISDLLPSGYTFKSANPSQGSYSSSTGIWSVGSLASPGSATLDLVGTVLTMGSYTDTASIYQSDLYDPIISNNSSSVTPLIPRQLACDVNRDQQINVTDINLITTAKGGRAAALDPRDLDGDSYITINDARGCVLRCDYPNCVVFPRGTINVPFSARSASTGGTDPNAYSITGGSLPGGLNLNGDTGALSGTPTATGTFPVTVRTTDASSGDISRDYTIYIDSPLSIDTASLPNGTRNVAYSQTLAKSGGLSPYQWSISSGALPTGLSIAKTTGIISGTPTVSGSYNFTVKLLDYYSRTVTKMLSINVP